MLVNCCTVFGASPSGVCCALRRGTDKNWPSIRGRRRPDLATLNSPSSESGGFKLFVTSLASRWKANSKLVHGVRQALILAEAAPSQNPHPKSSPELIHGCILTESMCQPNNKVQDPGIRLVCGACCRQSVAAHRPSCSGTSSWHEMSDDLFSDRG